MKKNNPSLSSKYKEAAKKYDSEVKKWFSSTEAKICASGNRTNFFKYANRKLKTESHIPSVLSVNGNFLTADSVKADYFNEKFVSVFQKDNGIDLDLPEKNICLH